MQRFGHQLTRLYRYALIALLLGALMACQKADTPATATPAEAPASVAVSASESESIPQERLSPLGDYHLLEVTLGAAIDAEQRVMSAQTHFAPDATFYLSVVGSSATNDLGLSARWLDASGKVLANAEQVLAAGPASVTTFSAHHPQAWPVGHYRVELSVNNNIVDFREFDVP